MIDQLFVEIQVDEDTNQVYTTVNSFLAIYIYKYIGSPSNINLHYVKVVIAPPSERICINLACLEETEFNRSVCDKKNSNSITDLRLPSYIKDNKTYISGVCAVCREIISRNGLSDRRDLLGFKESCLLSPAENSIWTRFCEVDVISDVNRVLSTVNSKESNYTIPNMLPRLEAHMNEPVRMHNIYKLAREEANKQIKCSKDKVRIECTIPKENLCLQHKFAEGVSFTVADLLLYPSFKLSVSNLPSEFDWSLHFPLVSLWLNEVENYDENCNKLFMNLLSKNYDRQPCSSGLKFVINESERTSLYKADPKRYKPRNRIYTDQNEIESSLEKLTSLDIQFTIDSDIFYDNDFDWESVDPGHIENSALPAVRVQRKKEQLENLANAVISLAKDNDIIVDFCSGTGHLGILLALKLPKCKIIILENKAISIERAKKRTEELHLDNCVFYQCNIDYFIGTFNIGTSLHACGTATDIVLKQCIRSRAHFVTCPCCYGSIRPMPHIIYPLSKQYRSAINEKEYLHIAHAADQAHQLGTINCKPEITFQGQLCMAIIDTDRKCHAENAGYKVILTKLKPENCTPKNHLLVGIIK